MSIDDTADQTWQVQAYTRDEMGYVLDDDEILAIAERVFQFCMSATGITLYPYQQEFGLRIVQSLLLEDGEEITALFSRQSGKTETVAVVVDGCIVILPILAKIPNLARDSRLAKFKDGFWVGIFGPSKEIAGIMHARMSSRLQSPQMKEAARDPEIDLDLPKGRRSLALSNGSFIDCNSAGPQSHIEGKTYHLILCEETQEISNYKLRKSIHPMGAATAATIVKIGTPHPHRNDFYDACERGRKENLTRSIRTRQNHFRFDWEYAARANPRYAKYIEKEIGRLGYESDEFRMAYRLHWLLERGVFIDPDLLADNSVKQRDRIKARVRGKLISFVRPDYPATQDRSTSGTVVGLDIGKTNDSTVLTAVRPWWDNPITVGDDLRYYSHILNWLELVGDDHEAQHPQILAFLLNYNVKTLVIDATGKGDPIADRLAAELPRVNVVPFVFNTHTKHLGYTLFYQELRSGRFTYPAGAGARKMRKYRNFIIQMGDLEKRWKGRRMVISKPKGKGAKKNAHDDYPDSAMLACWGVNGSETTEAVDFEFNPLFESRNSNSANAKARRDARIQERLFGGER